MTNFPEATRIAHQECARMLAVHDDPARPLPQQTVDGERTVLTLGSEEIQLLYPAPTTRSATSWSPSLHSAWVSKSG